jgi:hypothetical protein
MNLYLVHCGFYDAEVSEGIYEFHINIPVVEKSLEAAKAKVRLNPVFVRKKMHIDGIEEITIVDGHRVSMVSEYSSDTTRVQHHLHRDL